MKYEEALKIANRIKLELEEHCFRVEIAGSIRRKKSEVKDIEIVAIPKPYDIGLFGSGIALILDKYPIVKGKLPSRYTQRILPEGIKLDFFVAKEDTWGMVYAIRTGSADFSYKLAKKWSAMGWKSQGNILWKGEHYRTFHEEVELFEFLNMPFIPPEER